ncbi:Hypothetical predicted protein [Olea europaea subsp. europaea]|uniref:Uncharacterized protein n=1 Tax=Olea europaea subsp. europaea TaxID=158383 RepID=A0A8S0USH6_OLEEU|nr:Hypothetical predicted protein [Olea europaea subsp. europaea]
MCLVGGGCDVGMVFDSSGIRFSTAVFITFSDFWCLTFGPALGPSHLGNRLEPPKMWLGPKASKLIGIPAGSNPCSSPAESRKEIEGTGRKLKGPIRPKVNHWSAQKFSIFLHSNQCPAVAPAHLHSPATSPVCTSI